MGNRNRGIKPLLHLFQLGQFELSPALARAHRALLNPDLLGVGHDDVVAAGTKTLPTPTGSWGAFTTVKSVPVVMAAPLPTHPNAAVHAVMALAGIEFSYVVPLPGVELVILKVIVQEEFPTIVPFVRVIELAVFVITPPPH